LLSLIEHGMDETFDILDRGGKFFLTIPDTAVNVPIKVGPGGIAIK